jgi:NAD+ synthase (glutamine-hydrolysing)
LHRPILKPENGAKKPLFNSTALLQGGQVQQVLHKTLLPTYDVFDEDRYFQPSQGADIVNLVSGAETILTLGVTICEDLWNDEEFGGGAAIPATPSPTWPIRGLM